MATLYDHLGRPIDLSALRNEQAGPTLTGLRSVLTGHPADNMTPSRLARLLREAETGYLTGYLELAEQMEEKELHYRSVISTRKLQVSSLDLTVTAASDGKEDQRNAEAVRAFLDGGVLQAALYDILDAVGKGFSVCEIMWDTSGKSWQPREILWRDPRWFGVEYNDGRTILLYDERGQLVPLAPYKFITHVHKSKSGLPIRGGLARPAAWAYLFKNFDLKAWVLFAEVYGHPLRVGRYHSAASETDKEILLKAVRNIAADASAIIPEGMVIEFIDAKASGNAVVYEKLAEYLDRQISKLVLGQTGTTDTGSRVGTANAHEKVREDIEAADSRQLENTINRDLVRPLIDLNFGPCAAYPRIAIYREEQEDLSALVENLAKLVPLGLKVEASVIRDKMGLPDPEPGAECLGVAAPPETTPPATQPGTLPGVAASKEKHAVAPAVSAGQNPVDLLDEVDPQLDDEWEEQLAPLIAPVLALAEEAASAEDFLAALPGCILGQNPEALTEALARALFFAKLEGMSRAR